MKRALGLCSALGQSIDCENVSHVSNVSTMLCWFIEGRQAYYCCSLHLDSKENFSRDFNPFGDLVASGIKSFVVVDLRRWCCIVGIVSKLTWDERLELITEPAEPKSFPSHAADYIHFASTPKLIHLTGEILILINYAPRTVPRVEIVDERGLTTPDKFYKTGSTIELKCVVSKVPQPTSYVTWKHGLRMLNYDTSRGGIR